MRRRFLVLASFLLLTLVLAAACGGGGDSKPPSTPASTTAASGTPTSQSTPGAAATTASTPTSGGILPSGTGGAYISLGDSIAAGEGASDPATTSYVGIMGEALRKKYGAELEVINLAEGGATSQDVIDKQIPAAAARLQEGDVRLVTIAVGGNDLQAIQNSPNAATCIADVFDPACPVLNTVGETRDKLEAIMQAIYTAAPSAEIAILVYPNLYSGTGNPLEVPAGDAFDLLDVTIVGVASQMQLTAADPRRAFAGNGLTLTHLGDATPDPHPNDAGYSAIADSFLALLGLQR